MTRAKLLLLICALTVTIGTPAFALNPQPLPPGRAINTNGHTNHVFCANGNHYGR